MQYLDPEEDDILSKYEKKLELNCASHTRKLRKRIQNNDEPMSRPVENLPDGEECDVLTKYEREQETVFEYELSTHSKLTPGCFICVYCEKFFASEEGLSLHYKVLHKVYRCVKCSQNFSQEDYKIHSLVHKSSKPYSCLQCKKSFTKRCLLKRHSNRHLGMASLVCCLCNIGFQTKQEVWQHAQRKHKDSGLEEGRGFVRGNFKRCDVCKKYFQVLAEFERHYLSHMNTVKHVCPICQCEFSCEENLVKHRDIEHKSGSVETGFVALKSGKLFFCNVCHIGFVKKEYLEMHKWTHPTESAYDCEECQETFQTESELQTHYLEHVTEHYMIYDLVKKNNEISLAETAGSEEKIETIDFQVDVDEKCTPLSTNKSTNIFPQMNCEQVSCVTDHQIFNSEIHNKAFLNILSTAEAMTCSNEKNILQIISSDGTNIRKNEKTLVAQLETNKLLKERSDSSKPLVMDPLKVQVSTEFQSDALSDKNYLSTESKDYKFYEFLEKKYNLESIKCTRKASEFSREDVLYKGEGDKNMLNLSKNIKGSVTKMTPHLEEMGSGSELKLIDINSSNEVQLGTNLAYHCDICKKRCSSKDSLRLHEKRTHSNVSYNCSFCDKCYNRKDLLIAHERNKHSQIKPYSCHVCKKEFAVQRSLRLHLLMHTVEIPFRCEFCGKGFTRKTNFDVHLVGHEKDDCDSSGKEIVLENLVSQIPLEKAISPEGVGKGLKCRYCDKSFNKKTVLKKHTLTHYKASRVNFQCELCKLYFQSHDSLASHISKHANEDIVICDLCSRGFASSALLLLHKNSEH